MSDSEVMFTTHRDDVLVLDRKTGKVKFRIIKIQIDMNLLKKIKAQFAEVIEWENPKADTVWEKYPHVNDEIIIASKLILKPGQGCAIFYEGKAEAVLTEAGNYNLKTVNHPFITSLGKIRQLFESEHKLELYFFRAAEILNIQWGTAMPVKYIDKSHRIPVEMGCNGNFSMQISDVEYFYTNIGINHVQMSTAQIAELVASRITGNIAQLLATGRYPVFEVDSQLVQISDELKTGATAEFQQLGFILTDFRIMGTMFDAATMVRLGKFADVVNDKNIAEQVGLDYVQLEKLRALRDAASNPGGIAGAGLQMGMGMEIGKAFNMEKDAAINSSEDSLDRLKKLKALLDEGILTREEFESKKAAILDKL